MGCNTTFWYPFPIYDSNFSSTEVVWELTYIMKRLDKFEAINIIKEFVEFTLIHESWYKNILLHIKAVLLYGSIAKAENRLDSDIDILIVIPLKIEEKYTKGEYFYKYKGYEINIVLRSIEKMRKLASGTKDAFQTEVFRKSEIIAENDNEVRELIQKI